MWPFWKSRKGCAPGLPAPPDHELLELDDRLGRVEALRAGLGAVHDGVTAVQPERVLERVEALAGRLVAPRGPNWRKLNAGAGACGTLW